MIPERLDKLLIHKIYIWREKKSDKFLTLCQRRVIEDRILYMNEDLSDYENKSTTVNETIYRFATGDKEEKMCSQCKIKKTSFVSIERKWHTFCSRSCASRNKVENGIGNASKSGWKHSDKTKRKMSENHADFSGDKNPFKMRMETDESFRLECRKKKKDYWSNLSDERRKEISEIFSKAQALSENRTTRCHRNHVPAIIFPRRWIITCFTEVLGNLECVNFWMKLTMV